MKILISSDVLHEPYIRIQRYIFVKRKDDVYEYYEMKFNTSIDPEIIYLGSQTKSPLSSPISLTLEDHNENFSVIVEYERNGKLANISSLEERFDFFVTFPSRIF